MRYLPFLILFTVTVACGGPEFVGVYADEPITAGLSGSAGAAGHIAGGAENPGAGGTDQVAGGAGGVAPLGGNAGAPVVGGTAGSPIGGNPPGGAGNSASGGSPAGGTASECSGHLIEETEPTTIAYYEVKLDSVVMASGSQTPRADWCLRTDIGEVCQSHLCTESGTCRYTDRGLPHINAANNVNASIGHASITLNGVTRTIDFECSDPVNTENKDLTRRPVHFADGVAFITIERRL